jgi:nickel-dependent lactate racemase
LPGICGQKSTLQMHTLSNVGFRGKAENPVRQAIDEAGLKAGLDIIFNAVQDATGKLVDLVVGHPVRAHREGVKVSKEIYTVQVGSPADIVIVDSYPADIDFWQAGKAVEAASLVVKKGGVVILVTPCPDGVAPAHPIWLELAGLPEAEVRRVIDDGEDKVGALAALGQARATERATCIVVSPGITPVEKKELNLLHADTPQEALEMAFELRGREAEIIVLRRAGDLLPVGPHD